MKFLADESIDLPIVENLRKKGHVVLYVGEMDPGIKDDEAGRKKKSFTGNRVKWIKGRSRELCKLPPVGTKRGEKRELPRESLPGR